MDYQQAERYVLSFTDYEKTPGVAYTSTTYDLRRLEVLLARMGAPHLRVPAAHIAGTKGKGSTSSMIASVLTASGYRTGLFTSPHFQTMRERIRVDGEMIPEEDFAFTVEQVRPLVEEVNRQDGWGQLTTFEVLTAVAFGYFAQRDVQYQVLEVGLGGRLDATNVVLPAVCVITSISLDHTEVLGNTLEKIAAEKAGIIKRGVAVVSASQVPGVDAVIAETCRQSDAPLIRVGADVLWHGGDFDSRWQEVTVAGRQGEHCFRIPLLGEHQLENAACAVAALEVLVERGARIGEQQIAAGMSRVQWPGRLQVLRELPWVVCDGAHNADSAAKLKSALRRYFPYREAILVLGTSGDKDIQGMVRELAPAFREVIVARSRHPRSAAVDMLSAEFRRHGVEASKASSVAEAVEAALSRAAPEDLVCVTGSLFLVGEALEWWGVREGNRQRQVCEDGGNLR